MAVEAPRPDKRRVMRVQDRRSRSGSRRRGTCSGSSAGTRRAIRTGWDIRHGAGSRPTAGHQNRSALNRNSACSKSWTSGSSSASIEQRREVGPPHHRGEDHPGDDREGEHAQRRREWRTGRIQRCAVAGATQAQQQGDRRGQGDQRRRDEHQQDVLDHVQREERRVVGLDAGASARTRGPASRRGTRPSGAAGRGGRMRRVDPADGHSHQTTDDEDGEGRERRSNVQPKSRLAALGGSVGTGPWAGAGPASASASASPTRDAPTGHARADQPSD